MFSDKPNVQLSVRHLTSNRAELSCQTEAYPVIQRFGIKRKDKGLRKRIMKTTYNFSTYLFCTWRTFLVFLTSFYTLGVWTPIVHTAIRKADMVFLSANVSKGNTEKSVVFECFAENAVGHEKAVIVIKGKQSFFPSRQIKSNPLTLLL